MSAYSIKDLEQITGIKAHTLRIWEQRYDFIHPNRTATNIRYYSDDDLKIILNISFLKDHGYKITDINKMSADKVRRAVNALIDNGYGFSEKMHALTLAMIELNEEKLEKIFREYIKEYGLEQMMTQIIFPFLNRMTFQTNDGFINTVHKQFISNFIRRKLVGAIEAEKTTCGQKAETYILFASPEEKSEICLLFSHLILKKNKRRVINLGLDVKPQELRAISKDFLPDYIFTTLFSPASQLKMSQYLSTISSIFPSTKILITTRPHNDQLVKSLPKNVELISSGSKFISFVTSK